MSFDIIEEIKKLRVERRAIILAHNYQLPEVQDIADFTGDSLELSLRASRTEAEVIVFCGVYFMAETAKIISPQKTVLIPDPMAGCPMADMITAAQLRDLKKKHPQAKVLCYVNSSAQVKAESDVCCTSANAVEIINTKFDPDDEIIFVPDKYLAGYAASRTGRRIIPWQGYCPTHACILPELIARQKEKHPQARVIVHPECNGSVLVLADEILSTSGMLRYACQNEAREFIVGTEIGLLYSLQKQNPDKKFYPATNLAVCPNMKRINLEVILGALKNMKTPVTLPMEIIQKAQRSIYLMIGQENKTDFAVKK